MKINLNKCETILFRPPVGKCNSNIKRNWKSFNIKSLNNELIPNKQIVIWINFYISTITLIYNLEKPKKHFFCIKNYFFQNLLNQGLK